MKPRKNVNVALISIGRLENRYSREFIDYHLKVGIKHIYVIDNNRQGEEHFEDVLADYIKKGVVTIEDYRDGVLIQFEAFTKTYAKYKDQYDWIGIWDFDEFLDIRKGTLKSFLADRQSNCILINWECYGDNGQLHYEDKPVMERFPKPLPTDLHVQYENHAENEHIKCFIRGGLDGVRYTVNPHLPDGCQSYENAAGIPCKASALQPYDGSSAVLRHYITKSAEEWVEKFRRGGCDRKFDLWQSEYFDRFFKYNERTKVKEEILNGMREKVVAIVHYNTPELTEATIKSLRKHGGENYKVYIFDNSDERPWKKKMPGVKVFDNTKGQIIDFDKELAKFPDKNNIIGVNGKCVHGSTKHMMSVQKLWELLPMGFLLMDSDILLKENVDWMFMWDQCCCGHIQEGFKARNPYGIDRMVPMLCWINVPMCINGGARYFDPERTWGLLPGGDLNKNNFYDTGASFLEDIKKKKPACHGKRIDIRPLMEHLQSGSWLHSDRKIQDEWLERHKDLWN